MRVLRNDFPSLPGRTQRAVLHEVDASAERVRNAASDKTPPRVQTGAMMRGYRVERTGLLERAVYNIQPYHIYQELGTATVPPHPMLYPAAQEEWPRYQAALAGSLRDAWK